jgi:hypothetical protein
MEQVAATFASYRFGISILLAVGGIICIFFGYRLFSQGAGLYKSLNKLAIKHNEFSVSVTGMSTGGLLMFTSAAWAYYCYSSIPHFETNPGGGIKTVESQNNLSSGLVSERKVLTDRSVSGGGTVVGRTVFRYNPGYTNIDLPLERGRSDDVFSLDGRNIGTLSGFVFLKQHKNWQAVIEIKQFAIDVKPRQVTVDLGKLTDDPVLVVGLSEGEVKELLAIDPQDNNK